MTRGLHRRSGTGDTLATPRGAQPREPAHLQETRAAYDTVATEYAALLRSELDEKPWDRAVLAAYAELLRAVGGGPVLDAGCGPGRVTAHLHALGLDVSGVDLSPAMVAVARRDHPHLSFEVGSMFALEHDDASLAGLVAWYSTIHTPDDDLPALLAELHRVLAPGGQVLLAFQVGAERVRLERAYGHAIALDAYRREPSVVVERLREAGFIVGTTLVREPDRSEKVPQTFLVARRVP